LAADGTSGSRAPETKKERKKYGKKEHLFNRTKKKERNVETPIVQANKSDD